MRAPAWSAVLCALSMLGCAACQGEDKPTSVATPISATTHPATSSSANESALDENDVVGVVSNSSGDRIKVSVNFRGFKPLSSFTDTVIHSCDDQLAGFNATPERAVVIPITLSIKVLSSLATDLDVSLDDIYLAQTSNEAVAAGSLAFPVAPFWVQSYGDGTTKCDISTDVLEAGSVHWDAQDAQPGTIETWDTWLVLPDVITPNDSDGASITRRVLINPSVTLGSGSFTTFVPDTYHSRNVVDCISPVTGFRVPYGAVDPAGALSGGCTGPSSGGRASEYCLRTFPDGITWVGTEGGNVLTYPRESSLHLVCEGFGAPSGMDIPSALGCTVAGIVSVATGSEIDPVSDMCDTEDLLDTLSADNWLTASTGVGITAACRYVNGILSAVTNSENKAAVARAVGSRMTLGVTAAAASACGARSGLSIGEGLEAEHENDVMLDVLNKGMCIRFETSRLRSAWSSTACTE